MNFFKRLFGGGSRSSSDRFMPLYVFSHRCREPIEGKLDLMNELSLADEGGYYVRKVLHTSGQKRCFSEVEVELWFDKNKRLTNQEVQGGRWLDEDEYAAELARFNAPPAEESGGEESGGEESDEKENATTGPVD